MIKTIFLNKNTKNSIRLSTNLNIILSSEFYWVRVFELPISSKKEVLNVVPNLFEEFFDISGYKFYIDKIQDNRYICFAYKEDDIIEGLKNANIDHKKINNIYFAQNEFKSIADIIQIKDDKYSYKDDILVQIPKSISASLEAKELDLNSIELSKHKITLNRTSKYIDTKSAYILSGIFVILSLFIFAKTFALNSITNQYPIKMEKLKKDYHLLSSQLQTKSVLKQYLKVSNKYNNTREIIEYMVNFKSYTKSRLEKLEFQNNTIYGYYKSTSSYDLKQYFNKKYKNIKINKYGSTIKIGIKI